MAWQSRECVPTIGGAVVTVEGDKGLTAVVEFAARMKVSWADADMWK